MKIKEVREKYPNVKISYLPKKDFEIGLTDTILKIRRKDKYENVYIAREGKKYYILYPVSNFMTGSFITRRKAIDWFKLGGR